MTSEFAHKNTKNVLLYQYEIWLFQKKCRIKYLLVSSTRSRHISIAAVRRAEMKQVERIGVSLDRKLLSMFVTLLFFA